MDYGTDFLLEDDDIVFTADGDVKLVSGARTVAQDIAQTLKFTKGSIFWDEDVGSTLPLFLNDSNSNDSSLIVALERAAVEDPRVDPDSVKAYRKQNGVFVLCFTPIGEVKPETIEFDLHKNN